MSQEVKIISLEDLVLWTENPRDPISVHATDQDVVDKALADPVGKWSLNKLAKEMGEYYDFSELPTVVMHGKKPIVYDGNRRIILGKIKHGLVTLGDGVEISLPDFPTKIPCNVCTKEIALKNVLRKHGESGSWQPLERDIFLHKFMKQPKSAFLVIEESTGLISANSHLNHRFVKEEILKEDVLEELGFEIKGDRLLTVHDDQQARSILQDISAKVEKKEISTRNNRGKVREVLSRKNLQIIDRNRGGTSHIAKVKFEVVEAATPVRPRQTARKQKKNSEIFGSKLYLQAGPTSDLYRDIVDLYHYYLSNRDTLSSTFTSLIRMSLRLLCETAAKDKRTTLDKWLRNHFQSAKNTLDQDSKTSLSAQNVTEGSIVQLLHTGAHQYASSSNIEQTIAISIIIGEILKITHGKAN